MRASYTAREDGEWFPVKWRGQLIGCCDCALVHRVSFRVVKGRLQMKGNLCPQRTAARRHGKGIRVIKRRRRTP